MFTPHALCYDVPQWSTLGPLLFTLYIAVLSPFFLQDVIARHNQAPVVQKVDSAIHRINVYPLDSAIGFPNTYPLDSDLSGG